MATFFFWFFLLVVFLLGFGIGHWIASTDHERWLRAVSGAGTTAKPVDNFEIEHFTEGPHK